MKMFSESYTVQTTANNPNGIVSASGNIKVKTPSGREIWFPKNAKTDKVITYQLNEIGDEFVAYADSKTLDEDGMPVFLAGDVVKRRDETVEFVGFNSEMPLAPADTSTLEDKFALMAKYGISPKL
jgi:hypothetical protein